MTDALIDAARAEALVSGNSDARVDAARTEVLITFAVDVYIDHAMGEALVLMSGVGSAEPLWIPTQLVGGGPTVPMAALVWLPDVTTPTIRMGWGIILN